ncbi:DNA polymerase III subunit [Lachnoclostridium sp. Marseille-P6806]|uniref:DNA polymerase III subunit n=1 Tax=Lachnoclostridium sp. Marseille-P6806 TaxID=2364793 RepID=UPI0010304324|nr:DNA polymerase III subunit delta [Lachnoclostridium sp. Marseille-P6806]
MKKFTDIIGQEQIREYLQRALRDGRISHAYIIDGPADSDKNELAEVFAAALQCLSPAADAQGGGIEPCGECISCIQAAAGAHADIIHAATENKRSVGVDDVRAIRDDIVIRPYSGNRKVYIIRDAERMTAAAQNALLKTLEEPPGYAVLLLLADGVTGFLPTVLSRCVVLRMKPVAEQKIAEALRMQAAAWNRGHPEEPAEAGEEELAFCAGFAGGNPGRAFALLRSPGFAEERKKAAGLLERIGGMNAAELAAAAQEYAEDAAAQKRSGAGKGDAEKGAAQFPLTEFLRLWFRDVLVLKATGEEGRLLFRDRLAALYSAADRLSYEGLGRISEAQALYEKRRKANVSEALALELLLLAVRGQMKK